MEAASKSAGKGIARLLGRLAILLFLAWIVLAGFACILQRRLMYFPSAGPVPLPPDAERRGLRDVDLAASDGVPLKAWHWPGEKALTILVFHGNAGDRGHRLPWLEALRRTGAGVFILDYRGYGGSGGSPTEEGLYRDAEAAAAWIEANAPGPAVYLGESLGTGVAVELALRRPPAGIVLQSAFTSSADVGRRAYPFLPVGLFLKDRYDSLSKISRVSCPVLIIHGGKDSLVPIDMGRKLHERAPEPKEFLEIPGADHNDPIWFLDAEYLRRLGKFVDAALARRKS